MLAAVEISMYPLAADYRPLIEAFIVRLNSYPELHVVTNALSTQIWGPLDRLMVILGEEMGRVAVAGPQPVFVMKVLPGLARPAQERPVEDRPAEARPPTASAVPAPP
jgi:uncharacterized protein YqgV (UPF0045/DUF77 family)